MRPQQTMVDYKRLAGIGNHYDAWKRPSVLDEGAPEPVVSVQRARISRMANLFENEMMGGSLSMPSFDPQDIERLMEAAITNPRAHAAAQHHARAMAAHKHAHMVSAGGDAKASHDAHAQAAELHRTAAKHSAASGNVRMAQSHDAFARHHDQHAAHHARHLGNIDHTAHQPDEAPETAKPAKSGKKAGLVGKLKAKLQNIGGGGIDWGKEAAKTAPEPKAQKDPFPSKKAAAVKTKIHSISNMKPSAPKKTDSEMHSDRAHMHGRVVSRLHADPGTSHEQLAGEHHAASHENLHAALSAFHAGKHKLALSHFNDAIHHMNKHAEHKAAVMSHAAQASRAKAGGGPRAATGRAHV
jgi:hypothetical protein